MEKSKISFYLLPSFIFIFFNLYFYPLGLDLLEDANSSFRNTLFNLVGGFLGCSSVLVHIFLGVLVYFYYRKSNVEAAIVANVASFLYLLTVIILYTCCSSFFAIIVLYLVFYISIILFSLYYAKRLYIGIWLLLPIAIFLAFLASFAILFLSAFVFLG